MRVSRLVLACLLVFGVVMGAAALAQEGYPLKGSWLGDYGPNKTTRTPVFVTFAPDGLDASIVVDGGAPSVEDEPLKEPEKAKTGVRAHASPAGRRGSPGLPRRPVEDRAETPAAAAHDEWLFPPGFVEVRSVLAGREERATHGDHARA